MRVLVACEFSGVVRDAFRERGHDAWSVDILPTVASAEYHYQDDAITIGRHPDKQWDLIIAHPPCTYLCNSGVLWLVGKNARMGRMRKMIEALDFWYKIASLPAEKMCIENPIPHKYARHEMGDYTQVIQPWQYGHGETKATCLWLKNLPELQPTDIVEGREQRLHRLSPGSDRAKLRSTTYQGIANAMAEQWS